MTEAIDVARMRQGLYRFFGEALAAPSQKRIELLGSAAVFLDRLNLVDYAFYLPWRELRTRLDQGVDVRTLETEYVRLFASGNDGALCPPIESHYTASAEGGTAAEAIARLQRTYAELGIALPPRPEAPDHVTSQLFACSILCEREADAWALAEFDEARRMVRREHAFLRLHLAGWFPLFRSAVLESTRVSFYAAVVDGLHAFLVHDQDWTQALAASTVGVT